MVEYLLNLPSIVLIAGVVALLLALALAFWLSLRYRRNDPSNYFVRWLTSEQKNTLQQASVPYSTTAITQGEEGLLFARKDFKRALRVLKARVIDKYSLNDNNIEEVVLAFALPKDKALRNLTVVFDGQINWFAKWQLAHIVRDVLIPSVKSNIVVHIGDGSTQNPIVEENFHLFLYSAAPGSSGEIRPPNTFCGIPIVRYSPVLSPSGTGVPIMDNTTNFTVAELLENCLYVHVDVLGSQRSEKPQMGLVARVLQKSDEELVADRFLTEIIRSASEPDQNGSDTSQACTYEISATGFSTRRQLVVTSLIRDLLVPALQSKVVIQDCGGRCQPPVNDGAFHIFFYSSPSGAVWLEAPERVWGYRLLKRDPAFAPSATGLPIVDDAGFAVGELHDNHNLYLYQKYLHYGSKMEAALLARLLLEVRKELTLGAPATPEDLRNRISGHFINECQRQVHASPAGNGQKVSAQDLSKTQKELEGQLKGTRLEELNFVRLQAAPTEELGREFDELLKIEKVKNVQVVNDKIIVTTSTLYCVNPKTRLKHEIGAFEIHIFPRSNALKWFNMTRRVHGGRNNMNAPHVDENGNACLGNTKDLFPMLISKREFTSVVELAIAFVESVNITNDQWGPYIVNWPIAAS